MTNWELKRLVVEREYEITEAPEFQDSRSSRRLVIRPRKVTLYQAVDTNLVRGAVIEGRQVRRDGELSGSKMILVGLGTAPWGYNSAPPTWLNRLLEDEGLAWTTRTSVVQR